MKSIFTLLLCCMLGTAFAQTPETDDIYGNSRKKKSLLEVDQPKINLNLPGNHLKKAANSFVAAVVFGVITGVAVGALSKNKNPDMVSYVGIGGGLLTIGLFTTSAAHLGKAGDELNKVFEEQQKSK